MGFAKVHSAQTFLLNAKIVDVEVDLSQGLHAFAIVGLPDKAVEEARDRVSAAIKNSGYTSPKQKNQKVVVSLAPADIRKEGANFDVAIAIAYLIATGDIRASIEKKLFLGELALDGSLRPLPGVLHLIYEAAKRGFEEIFVPYQNAPEAALIEGVTVYPAKTLEDIIEHINEAPEDPEKIRTKLLPHPSTSFNDTLVACEVDFSTVRGQETAKRGLEIAVAGGHNIALFGPPGTGKTMLAKAARGILPPLTFEEALEVGSIYAIIGTTRPLTTEAPFRSPHHTSSYVSLIGGGAVPKPGEITLAHRGILFLDEFPEFDRRVIDALRQPLEDRVVSVARARGSAQFPAHFVLIAAMNPCPCGFYKSISKPCVCTELKRINYQRKISGPIIDRIDMWIEVAEVKQSLLSRSHEADSTATIRERIDKARAYQQARFKKQGVSFATNNAISAHHILKIANLTPEAHKLLTSSAEKLNISARSYHRIMRLARTIADLEASEEVKEPHILEALQYRPKLSQ